METSSTRTFPRWAFLILSIGGAWASGIYLGKITIEGASTGLLIPAIGYGLMSLIMAWGAHSGRRLINLLAVSVESCFAETVTKNGGSRDQERREGMLETLS